MARYRTGHQDDALARELTQKLNRLMNAWHSGDSEVFKARFKEVDSWLRRYGFGERVGRDFWSETAAGRTGMSLKGSGIREGLEFISKAMDLARPVSKGMTWEQYVEAGVEYDAQGSELLMQGARELAQTTGKSVSDCLSEVANAEPELVQCNRRRSSHTSRAYWSRSYGTD